MSDLNKIPFGLRELDNALVDVYDFPNGRGLGQTVLLVNYPLWPQNEGIVVVPIYSLETFFFRVFIGPLNPLKSYN